MELVYIPDAQEANIRISELEDDLADLRAENERLRCKLMPAHFITAYEAMSYLESIIERLNSAHERRSVEITIMAIKRLSNDNSATAWWQPQAQGEEP